MDLIVVDGPNLYNAACAALTGILNDRILRDYVTSWFDIDRLVLRSTLMNGPPKLGIVIFHSRRPLGRDPYRLEGRELDGFWARQAANPNSSAMVVDIPGDQQDAYEFRCSNCGVANHVISRSEKGIDTSIVTYLFETSSNWESVCLFSKDVDFMPPVLSLRRMGKQVFCASSDATTTALVRVCQSHFPVHMDFLRDDLRTFDVLRTGGVLDQLLSAFEGSEDMLRISEWHDDLPGIRVMFPAGQAEVTARAWQAKIDELNASGFLRWKPLADDSATIIADVQSGHVLGRHQETYAGSKWWNSFEPLGPAIERFRAAHKIG